MPAIPCHAIEILTDRAERPWARRPHAELARLTRELLLAGHLMDRSGMPLVIARFGQDAMREVAIGQWMAASPIYTRRTQRLLGFSGDSVETIFKGMQFDIGAPPEFMDFRYVVHDPRDGEFHLAHCGALMDVEPMGEDYVVAMCHHIEDPTFDATASATNPRARMRPVHRPPRAPADRSSHCHWTVTIDDDHTPLAPPAESARLGSSRVAELELARPDPSLATDDGWNDYGHPLDPDLVAEDLSSAALSAVLDEVALQGHLLSRAYLLQVADRTTAAEATAIGRKQATGIAGLTAKRLAATLEAEPDLPGVAAVLAVHPLLLPRPYVAVELDLTADRLVLGLPPSPSRAEPDGLTWPSLLADGGDSILAAMVTGVSPRATIARQADRHETVRWEIRIDPDAPPAKQSDEVTVAEFSTGADFAFGPSQRPVEIRRGVGPT